MSGPRQPDIGAITWTDLSVPDAEAIRAFYGAVVGWQSKGHDMGTYEDFEMTSPVDGRTLAGICHARGPNADLPPQWLPYITVADVDESARRCLAGGGEVLVPPRSMGSYGRLCVIRDPAGAAAALLEPPPASGESPDTP